MKTRIKRQRTNWDWRLRVYPIIVIPMMVYLNASPAVQQSAGPRTASAVAGEAPVQGVNAKGAAYVWERNPKYPVVEFVMILTDERR